MKLHERTLLLALASMLAFVYVLEYGTLPFIDGPLYDSLVYLEQARHARLGQHVDPTLLAFSPLYGYFLALFGAHALGFAPVIVQGVLWIANIVLLRRIVTRVFDEGAARWTSWLVLLYGPLLFYASKVLSETLGLTLLLVSLDRLTVEPSRPRDDLLAGLSLALSILARASLLFVAPLFIFTRRSIGRAALLSVALAAPLVAHGVYTYARTGLFVPVILVSSTAATATHTSWNGGLDAFRGAHEEHVGAFSVVDQARKRLERARNHEAEPSHEGVSIAGWLRNVPAKAVQTFRDEETSFDYGFYGERSEVKTLRLTFVSFGMLGAWALVGLVFALRERRGFVLAPIFVGILVVTTLFHPSARYRLPLVLVLAPLAGLAWARAQRNVRVALVGIALFFAIHDLQRGLHHPGLWQLRVAEAAATAGDDETCKERVAAARALEPTPEVEERARYVSSILRGCR